MAALNRRLAKDKQPVVLTKDEVEDAIEVEAQEEMHKRERARHHQTLLQEAQEVKRRRAVEGQLGVNG